MAEIMGKTPVHALITSGLHEWVFVMNSLFPVLEIPPSRGLTRMYPHARYKAFDGFEADHRRPAGRQRDTFRQHLAGVRSFRYLHGDGK